MRGKVKHFFVNKGSSIKEAMRVIDKGGLGVAFVVDKDRKLSGVATDGDIRRSILRGVSTQKPIEEIANKKPIVINAKFREKELQKIKIRKDIKGKIPIGGSLKIPVIDDKGEITDVVFIYKDKKNNLQPFKPELRFIKEGVRKVLLIGGAGYLGSVLCQKLLNQGYQVRVLDNLTYGNEGMKGFSENKNFEFFKGDIRNIADIVEGIKGVDAVIHLAAIVGDPASARNPEETLEINYLATKTIVETCKYFQINRFIFASTCSIYGESPVPEKQLTEESPLNPVSLYAETKIKCEELISEAIDENFSPTIFRMATLYGYSPNMRFDLAVNLLTAKALFDKKVPIFGGSQWRPWLHLEDAAKAYIACLEEPIEKIRGETFNVLSENHQMIDVGKIIHSIYPSAVLQISKKMTDKRNYNVSFAKIAQILNYQPKKKIADGISEIKNVIQEGLIKNYKDPKYRTSFLKA